MTIEEYNARAESEQDWAPGWDAIDETFGALYLGQTPAHYGTALTSRAIFGGPEYLDGYSLYNSPNGYWHIVSYGMSELYANGAAFGGEFSKWGYELTLKLKERTAEDCRWALNMLGNLARYTCSSGRRFKPYQYIGGDGSSINLAKPELKISGLLVAPDTEAASKDTPHGRLDFLQLVGLTKNEVDMLIADPEKARPLAKKLQDRYPNLETDMYRTEEYIF